MHLYHLQIAIIYLHSRFVCQINDVFYYPANDHLLCLRLRYECEISNITWKNFEDRFRFFKLCDFKNVDGSMFDCIYVFLEINSSDPITGNE